MFSVSIILILLSSFFIISVLNRRDIKKNTGFIYLLLTAFAQIILSFELLSLFSAITVTNFLSVNFVIFLISIIIFKFSGSHIYKPSIKLEMKKIINALRKDKILKYISVFFCFFIVSEFILATIPPIGFGDTYAYYLSRCTRWIWAGNFQHYITSDVRELIMPVNMDLLYTWKLLFTKSEQSIAVFSYISYILAIYVIYNLLGELGFCRRKRLWSVFVFSAFSIIGIMSYTPLADLFTGSLMLTAVYLFLVYCKYNNKTSLFFSALSFALAIGTKTTAIIASLSVFIIFIMLLNNYKKQDRMKSFLLFLMFLSLNFLVFSSYNYILNFIEFSHPVSNKSHILLNQFRGGVTGYIYNIVNYIFYAFDLSGLNNIDNYNNFLMNVRKVIFEILKHTGANYISPYYKDEYVLSSEYNALYSALGALGILTFYPTLIYCIFSRKTNSVKSKYLFVTGLVFIFNVLLFAGLMIYTRYNVRYLVTFFVISSPIVVCTYYKSQIYRWFLCAVLFLYLFFNPFVKAAAISVAFADFCIKNNSQSNKLEEFNKIYCDTEKIFDYFISAKNNKIAVIENHKGNYAYFMYKLRLFDNMVDKINVEDIKYTDLNKYNYIIASKNKTHISNDIRFKEYNADNYVTTCKYRDKNKKLIKNNENASLTEAVKVNCDVPLEYIEQNGFVKDRNKILSAYTVYKKPD